MKKNEKHEEDIANLTHSQVRERLMKLQKHTNKPLAEKYIVDVAVIQSQMEELAERLGRIWGLHNYTITMVVTGGRFNRGQSHLRKQ